MDDYASKPIDIAVLGAIVSRWVHGGDGGGRAEPEPGPAPLVVLDGERISTLRSLQRKGEPDVLAGLARPFLEDASRHLGELGAALAAADAAALGHLAHALKGSSANLGATRLAALCGELEVLGRSGELTFAAEVLSHLETEVDRVRAAFEIELS